MQREAAPLTLVDAHHHLWDPASGYPWMRGGMPKFMGDTAAVHTRYEIEDLLREAQAPSPLLPSPLRLAGSVHLQCGRDPQHPAAETAWVQQQSERSGLPVAIVGHANLADPALDAVLEAHARHSGFRGVRQMLNWSEDPRYQLCDRGDYLVDPAWRRGFARLGALGLSFDLQVNPWQLTDAARALQRHPDTVVVLNHAGLPFGYRDSGFPRWREGLGLLAALPRTCVKFSGLGMVDPGWTPASARPVFDALLQSFGVQRILFGSNFPIDRLYGGYQALYARYLALCEGLPPVDLQALCAGNAARVYRLTIPDTSPP